MKFFGSGNKPKTSKHKSPIKNLPTYPPKLGTTLSRVETVGDLHELASRGFVFSASDYEVNSNRMSYEHYYGKADWFHAEDIRGNQVQVQIEKENLNGEGSKEFYMECLSYQEMVKQQWFFPYKPKIRIRELPYCETPTSKEADRKADWESMWELSNTRQILSQTLEEHIKGLRHVNRIVCVSNRFGCFASKQCKTVQEQQAYTINSMARDFFVKLHTKRLRYGQPGTAQLTMVGQGCCGTCIRLVQSSLETKVDLQGKATVECNGTLADLFSIACDTTIMIFLNTNIPILQIMADRAKEQKIRESWPEIPWLPGFICGPIQEHHLTPNASEMLENYTVFDLYSLKSQQQKPGESDKAWMESMFGDANLKLYIRNKFVETKDGPKKSTSHHHSHAGATGG